MTFQVTDEMARQAVRIILNLTREDGHVIYVGIEPAKEIFDLGKQIRELNKEHA